MQLRSARHLRLLLLALTVSGLVISIARAQSEPEHRQMRRDKIRAAATHRASLEPDLLFFDEQAGGFVPGVRCATHGVPVTDHEHHVPVRSLLLSSDTSEDRARNKVRVHFHVVHDGEDGKVSKADIRAQIRVLNAAFRPNGFKFRLKEITYTDDRDLFRHCVSSSGQRQIARSVGAKPNKFLNIYTCKPSRGTLGFAYLPDRGSGFSFDGVWLLHSTLPNGSAFPYNEGDTATHEVGHFLGLFHTFELGCSKPGDRVADTPYESSPAFGCPIGRDSCPADGADPVQNFMDYTDDACMIQFTPGQADRMRTQTRRYRSNL